MKNKEKGEKMKDFNNINVCCPVCGKNHIICLNDKQMEAYIAYKQGKGRIQDLLPDLSNWEREALISGLCKSCQDIAFSEPDNED